MPSNVVRIYALGDVDLPGRIFSQQKVLLKSQGLWDLFIMETKLLRTVLKMRKQGVRVDRNKLIKTGMELSDESYRLNLLLTKTLGREINPGSNKDLQWVMDKYRLSYPYNPPTELMMSKGIIKGNPKLDKDVLMLYKEHEVVDQILKMRHYGQLNSLFVRPYLNLLVGDRLHADFNTLRSDDSGTITGRFSGSNPNLQQAASKTEEEFGLPSDNIALQGKLIRKCFLPEEGYSWLSKDWSQIEYRIIAHYARGPGADEIRRRYNEDPDTDYHTEIGEMTSLTIRKIIKNLNFGTAYEMGPKTMSVKFGWELDYAKELYNLYHRRVPFIKHTSRLVQNKAIEKGYIVTLLGRRGRLQYKDKSYVMLNKLIQGTAADIMKACMVEADKRGIFEVLPLHATVHDELDNSLPATKEGKEAAKALSNVMENLIKLRVPIKVSTEVGPTWGDTEKVEDL
jgi:DNA polymerase-1